MAKSQNEAGAAYTPAEAQQRFERLVKDNDDQYSHQETVQRQVHSCPKCRQAVSPSQDPSSRNFTAATMTAVRASGALTVATSAAGPGLMRKTRHMYSLSGIGEATRVD
jgi:hypothetical protein